LAVAYHSGAERCATLKMGRNAHHVRARTSLFAVAALCACGASRADEVLLLQPGNPNAPEQSAIEAGLRNELAGASLDETRIYAELLDSAFSEPLDQSIFADYLRAKYGNVGIDAVIALSDEAVRFVADHRSALSNVPLVYVARDKSAANAIPESAAVVTPFDPSKTVELALRLQPALDNVFVVGGEQSDAPALRAALGGYSSRLDIEYLEGLEDDEVLDRVAQLPANSAVLYASLAPEIPADWEMARRLSDRANAPVYGVDAGDIGRGIVGGYMTGSEQVGAEIARQTMRVLRGEYPKAADVGGGQFIVDARALSRWQLDQTRLPPDTELAFAPPSIWTLYQGWILTLLVLVAVQFALIVTLLVQSISRRRDRLILAETAHRFRLARVAGKVGIWQWNLEDEQLIVEPELKELLGYDTPEADGLIADWTARVHEEDLPKLRRAARDHAAGLTPSFELQYRMLDQNGNVRWLLARGQLVARSRLIGTAIDITDRKHDEDERARTLVQLQEQRNELAHLGRAAMAGALSGAVAHELNQPLSAMMSNARAGLQFLARGPVDGQEIKDILSDIESDGRRAGQVIGHLRNLLRRGEAQFETVQVDVIVDQVLRLIHSDIVNLNIRVLHDRSTGLSPIYGDPVQLQQVLLNLLANACDALTSTDPRDRRITIGVGMRSGRVRLSVSDNGCGFTGNSPDHLFKPFVTTKLSGLGLGLSISRSIVEAHGGRIWAESNREAGATFYVELAGAAAERGVA